MRLFEILIGLRVWAGLPGLVKFAIFLAIVYVLAGGLSDP
jgi:hypothetical protein